MVKGYKAKSAQGKGTSLKSEESQAQASKSPLSVDSHDTLNSSLNELWLHVWKVVCQGGKLLRDSVSRVFTEGWSHGHHLTNTQQHSRLPERKQVFRQLRHSEPLLSLSVYYFSISVENCLPFKLPDTRQGRTLQVTFLKRTASGLLS